jgi:uncharacterized protein YgiM (DUF1202 family)
VTIEGAVAVADGLRLNMRAAPDLAAAIVAALEDGSAITALARSADGGWLQVQTADGTAGWVSTELVVLASAADLLPVAPAPNSPAATGTADGEQAQ